MLLDLDVTGRRVVVFGTSRGTRRVVRRYTAAGARVRLAPAGVVGADARTLLRLVGPAWLVVTVDPEPAVATAVGELAAKLRVLAVSEPAAAEDGQVTLVGGGPGSVGLLTAAARAALREADVVCFDRLAPTDELADLAPGAELIDVGKSPYHHKISQDRIEDLLVSRARRGDNVVRLKGGDPFVFGRGSEELAACAAAGVAVRVVPGVTSAIAVPASAGIPLTHRGLSHAFTVVSGHALPSAEELDALVRLGGTIVILMGVGNLSPIAAGLRGAGLADDTPVAVIERGFSDSQRTTTTALSRLADDARRLDVAAPAVVVIGEVVRLGSEVAAQPPLCALDPALRA